MMGSLATFFVLSVFSATAPNDVLPHAVTYLEAHRAERAGNYAQAIVTYEACAKDEGGLGQYAALAVARSRSAMGDVAGAASAYRALIAEGPDGPWRLQAKAALAMLPIIEGATHDTLALLDEVVAVSPQPWWMQPYAWRAAEHHLKIPTKEALGYAYFRSVVATNPYRKLRLEAARTLSASPSLEDRAAAVMGFARSQELNEAGETLAAMIMKIIQEEEAPADLNQLLAYLLGEGDGTAPERAAPASLGSNLTQLVLTYVVYQSARKERWAAARTASQQLTEHYAMHEEAANVLWWLGSNLQGNDQDDAAEEIFRALSSTFPDHSRADDALYRVSLLQWWRGDKEDATETLLALTEAYPESAHVAHAYFLLAEFETERDADKAKAYRTLAASAGLGRYYAHRARSELLVRKTSGSNIHIGLFREAGSVGLGYMPEVALESTQDETLLPDDVRIARLRFFGAHGIEEAHWEALALCRALHDNPARATYIEAIAQAGFAHMAFQWENHLSKNGDDDDRPPPPTTLLYPRVYWPVIQKVSKETGVDPYLLLAVAKQESTFRARIQSTAGAVGVMQLMPSTARWMAEITKEITIEEVNDLHSPRNSIRIGAYYLRRLKDNTKGDIVEALAAYNGGPGNVAKWQKRFPNLKADEFIESIPFDETRHYVKRVLGYYAAYHSIYAPVG